MLPRPADTRVDCQLFVEHGMTNPKWKDHSAQHGHSLSVLRCQGGGAVVQLAGVRRALDNGIPYCEALHKVEVLDLSRGGELQLSS